MRRMGKVFVTCGLVAALSGGCGKNITADTTLAELLNQITVGDVVNAFQQFVSAIAAHHGGFGPQLTDDQRKQIEALQSQLDAGTITQDDFVKQVQTIIGDAMPNEPFVGFGFFGGPFGHHGGLQVGGYLNLTQEQVDAAKALFDTAHSDIDALREKAKTDILAVLTDEQKATLADLGVGLLVGLPPGSSDATTMRPHGGFGFGHGGFGGAFGDGSVLPTPAFDRFASLLKLTDDQKAQIQAIRSGLVDAIKARHEQARTDFMNLLTDEQKAKLDQFLDDHGIGGSDNDGDGDDKA